MPETTENKYSVCMDNEPIAENMTFEMAMAFIEGYRCKFYGEWLDLNIKQTSRGGEDNGDY